MADEKNLPTPSTPGSVYAEIAPTGKVVVGVNTNGHLIFSDVPAHGNECCNHIDTGGTGGGSGGGGGTIGDIYADQVILDPNGMRHVTGTDVQIAVAQLDAAIGGTGGGGGSGTGGSNGNIGIVTEKPIAPGTVEGETVWDQSSGHLYLWNGSAWVDVAEYYTPNAPKGVDLGSSLPATGQTEGQPFFNTSDNKLYFWIGGKWQTAEATITPDATQAIVIVDDLPALPNASYPVGSTIYSRKQAALFTNVSGAWQDVTHTATPNAPEAVETVGTLPAMPNANYPLGRVVFNLADNKLYKSTGAAWELIPQTATIAAGQIQAWHIAANAIGADQIAANAIATKHLQANSVTAGIIAAAAVNTRELAAGAITADKIAAGAIIAGKIQAGAIGANEIAAQSITADRIAMNTLVVGSANIADANVTTLKINGEAVNVIRQVNYQQVYNITQAETVIMTLTVYFPHDCKVCIQYTGTSMYNGVGISETQNVGAYWVRMDGVNQIGWYLRETNASTCMREVKAGTHTFDLYCVNTPTAGVAVGNCSLVVHGAMR